MYHAMSYYTTLYSIAPHHTMWAICPAPASTHVSWYFTIWLNNLTCSCKIKLILWKNKHQKWWKRITKRNTDWEEKKVRYLNSIQFYSIQPCILSTIFAYDVSSLALYLWLYLLIDNKQIILSYTLLLYDAIF